ncbi:MAG: hypothetical protein R2712_22200 [Vicinamibacterales bacterium]
MEPPARAGRQRQVFQPMANGKATGDFEVFAGGFAGRDGSTSPGDAVYRPDGVAVGLPFITESQKDCLARDGRSGGSR